MITAPTYFVDTSVWISLLEAGDDHHPRAVKWQEYIVRTGTALMTSEPVLWEILNHFSPRAVRLRGVELYRAIHSGQIDVYDFESELCEAAVRVYASRPDKEWGVIDSFSFELMRAHGLTEALTADHHFEQAGFSALLLRDPPA